MIIDVLTEDGIQRAKLESTNPNRVRYMFKAQDDVWKYENVTYIVEEECIDAYYDTSDEEDCGMVRVADGWVWDSDSDYEPSDEENLD